MTKFLFPIFLVLSCFLSAQQSYVYYNTNVEEPLSYHELSQLSEVYGEDATYVKERPGLLRDIKDLLRNRILIQEIPWDKTKHSIVYSNAIDLTTVPLYTVFNSNIKRDYVYTKDNFNLLKYRIQLFPSEKLIYRLGNYYITIRPQFRRDR